MASIDLSGLERDVAAGLERRDLAGLNVLGFGEISVAFGVPTDAPTHVAKRMPAATVDEADEYEDLVVDYVAALTRLGVGVVETDVVRVPRSDDEVVVYLAQPLLASNTIGDKVLQAAEPDPSHPMIEAIGETIVETVTADLSIDAQVSNWSWDGAALTLVDVGTPFTFSDGQIELDMKPFMNMFPAPVRPLVKREMFKVTQRWRSPQGVLMDAVANLLRVECEHWIEPAAERWSQQLVAAGHPAIEVAEARKAYADDLKLWPFLRRLQRVERRWSSIRGRDYDFFIQNSYDGTMS